MRRRWGTIALLGAALAGLGSSGAGAATPTYSEFSAGFMSGGNPISIAPARDGNLFFTLPGGVLTSPPTNLGESIGRMQPGTSTGEFAQFSSGITADSAPYTITGGPDGNMWFTEAFGNKIGRFNVQTGTMIQEIPTGSLPAVITSGPDGALWFTENGSNRIVKRTIFSDGSGSSTPYTAGIPANAGLAFITSGPDRNLWFTAQNANKIGRITTSGAVTMFPTNAGDITADAALSAIAPGPDGNLWFTEPGATKIGRITPSGVIKEFEVEGDLFGIAAGPDGNVWFTTTRGDTPGLGRIDPDTEAIDYFGPTSNASSGGRATGITAGPDGNMWITVAETHRIGRMTTAVDRPAISSSAIQVPATGTSVGKAGPSYPNNLSIGGLQGTVTSVTVRLNGVHHAYGNEIQAQLEGPGGQTVVLTRGKSGGSNREVLNGQVITFSKSGRIAPAQLTSGIFKPFGDMSLAALPAPAPATTNQDMSVFDGTNPNGTWKLYLSDRVDGDNGVLANGWSLDVKTTGPPAPPVQGDGGTGQTGGGTGSQTGTGVLPSGGPSASVFTPRDTVKPTLKLGKLASKFTLAKFRKGLSVGVTPSESATVKCTLATVAKKPKTLATATKRTGKATTCKLKPSKKKLGKPKKTFKVKVSITATDAAGNKGTTSKTITVKP